MPAMNRKMMKILVAQGAHAVDEGTDREAQVELGTVRGRTTMTLHQKLIQEGETVDRDHLAEIEIEETMMVIITRKVAVTRRSVRYQGDRRQFGLAR